MERALSTSGSSSTMKTSPLPVLSTVMDGLPSLSRSPAPCPVYVLVRIPARENAPHARRLQSRRYTHATDGTRHTLRQARNDRCDAVDRRLELLGIAREADPQKR